MGDAGALTRPIGWWLKEADAAINSAFDHAVGSRGADRRTWQILSTLGQHPHSTAELSHALASFDSADMIVERLQELQNRSWVESEGDSWQLTAAGDAERAALATEVGQIRRRVAAALPEEDYATLIGLLDRLVTAVTAQP